MSSKCTGGCGYVVLEGIPPTSKRGEKVWVCSHPVVQWSVHFPGQEETWVRSPAGPNVFPRSDAVAIDYVCRHIAVNTQLSTAITR